MLWYDITFSLDKAVSPSLQGSTALALFSAGKIHSADQPATANPILSTTIEKFTTFRRGDPCLQAGEEAPPPFEFLLNRFFSFPADAASCS